jgi:hypothetical protein
MSGDGLRSARVMVSTALACAAIRRSNYSTGIGQGFTVQGERGTHARTPAQSTLLRCCPCFVPPRRRPSRDSSSIPRG